MLLIFAKSAYSAESLNRAAYKVASLGIVRIAETDTSWEVTLAASANSELEELSHEFHTNLSDEALREIVRSRTEGLRSLILAHAYSNTRIANEDATA